MEEVMSTHPNFQLRIETLVNLPPRGILTKGRVEGGELHVGDAVRVRNSPMVITAIVTLITVKDLTVKQETPGSEATLSLVGLTLEDIHAGEVLSPGRL
jgi:translation elongation factor EF-Tu-like GTPase